MVSEVIIFKEIKLFQTGDNSVVQLMDIVSNVSDTVLKTLPVDKPISVVGDNIGK